MRKRRTGTRKMGKLSKANFNKMKKLFGFDLPNKAVASLIGASDRSTYLWRQFDTWEDYCSHKAKINLENQKGKGNLEPKVKAIRETVETFDVGQEIHRTNKLLERLVKAWERPIKPKSPFER